MSGQLPPRPLGDKWNIWGERINKFIVNTRNNLEFRDSESKATVDGILMWDAAQDAVVVSKNGAWVKLKYDP
jgi:hypothetical protein|tara:strand:+ start:1312 stop:1527 length:216 start_codon:yes stop_codon:yes gene_type:complete